VLYWVVYGRKHRRGPAKGEDEGEQAARAGIHDGKMKWYSGMRRRVQGNKMIVLLEGPRLTTSKGGERRDSRAEEGFVDTTVAARGKSNESVTA